MGRRGSYQKAERYGDRVRLYAPTKTKPWRVVAKDPPPEVRREGHYEHEADARAECERLRAMLGSPGAAAVAANLARPYGLLLDEYLQPHHHPKWGNSGKHAYNVQTNIEKWIRPVLGTTPGGNVNLVAYERVLARQRRLGGHGSLDLTRRVLSAVHYWGGRRDFLPQIPFPVSKTDIAPAKASEAGTDEDQYVPEEMRPDRDRVLRLLDALAAVGRTPVWWRTLQGEVAAFMGLREGETFALRSCHILEAGRRVRVRWQYTEGRGAGGQLMLLHLPPKNGKRRMAIADPWLAERLARRAAEATPGSRTPACVDCGDPGCALLFPSPTGGPHRQSVFGRDVARKAMAATRPNDDDDDAEHEDVDPAEKLLWWPKDKAKGWIWCWHDLRHHAALFMINEQDFPLSDAALLLGHSEDTLMRRYYGTADRAVARSLAATENRIERPA